MEPRGDVSTFNTYCPNRPLLLFFPKSGEGLSGTQLCVACAKLALGANVTTNVIKCVKADLMSKSMAEPMADFMSNGFEWNLPDQIKVCVRIDVRLFPRKYVRLHAGKNNRTKDM